MSDTVDHFPAQITDLPAFDGPFDAFRLAADGCDVLFASYPGGTTLDAHDHPSHNVGIVTKGRLELIVSGESRFYDTGDWYDLPAGTSHAAAFAEDSAIIELWFQPEGA